MFGECFAHDKTSCNDFNRNQRHGAKMERLGESRAEPMMGENLKYNPWKARSLRGYTPICLCAVSHLVLKYPTFKV